MIITMMPHTEAFPSPNTKVVSGIPYIMKLLRKIAWMIVPLRGFSFTIRGTRITSSVTSTNRETTLVIISAVVGRFSGSAPYTFLNIRNGKNSLKFSVFSRFINARSVMPDRTAAHPTPSRSRSGMTALNAT